MTKNRRRGMPLEEVAAWIVDNSTPTPSGCLLSLVPVSAELSEV